MANQLYFITPRPVFRFLILSLSLYIYIYILFDYQIFMAIIAWVRNANYSFLLDGITHPY